MTRDFCFWLKGYLDRNEGDPLSHEQVEKVRAKLAETLKASPVYYGTPHYPYWATNSTFANQASGSINTNSPEYYAQQQLGALSFGGNGKTG